MKTIKDYPIQTVMPTDDDIMWIFSGKWSLLDNFALLPIRYQGQVWPTSEHAYAAKKSLSGDVQDLIRKMPDPGRAKAAGRRCDMRPDWEDVKFQFMWEILLAKFAQHPSACKVLLASGGLTIYEGNTWNDDVWGMIEKEKAGVWVGRNALGSMLMEIRSMLVSESTDRTFIMPKC